MKFHADMIMSNTIINDVTRTHFTYLFLKCLRHLLIVMIHRMMIAILYILEKDITTVSAPVYVMIAIHGDRTSWCDARHGINICYGSTIKGIVMSACCVTVCAVKQ